MRDRRLQQRGQAPVSHLHQTGHPGLVLLLAGRHPLPSGAVAGGPPPLPSPPALATGRDPLLLFPRRARRLRFLPRHPQRGRSLPLPAIPGRLGRGPRRALAGAGRVLSRPCGLEAEADLPRVEGPAPAAPVSAGAGAARCAGYPGQVGTPGQGVSPISVSRLCRSCRQGSGLGSRGAL